MNETALADLRAPAAVGLVRQFEFGQFNIGIDHDADQVFEFHFGGPAEFLSRFGGVADEQIDFGGAFVADVVFDVLLPVEVEVSEGFFDEFARRTACDARPPIGERVQS